MNPESQEVPFPTSESAAWRIRHVEHLLGALDGVNSVKIVSDDRGEIQEIHVLSGSEIGAKQIVRNVESALLAELGLQIDHRKISVARMRGEDLQEIRDQKAPGEEEVAGRLELQSVEIRRDTGRSVNCTVELRQGESSFTGTAEGVDHSKARLEVPAEAALEAIGGATEGSTSLALEGVEKVSLFGNEIVVALVRLRSHRTRSAMCGAVPISDSYEEASVLSILQATNRWVSTALKSQEEEG